MIRAFQEWLHSVRLRWRMMRKRRRLDRDLEEELAFHREMRAMKYAAQGESLEAARILAARRFGNVTLTKETLRETWSFPWLDATWRDLQHAFRALSRTPGFTLIAVLTLAIGIGANTSVFTVMDALFLRSLPVRDPQQLRILNWTAGKNNPARGISGYSAEIDGVSSSGSFSWEVYQAFQKELTPVSGIAAFAGLRTNVATDKQAMVAAGQLVNADYFSVLGLDPILGRPFRAEEDRPEGAAVAIISHRLWQTLYAGSAEALGATISVERQPYTVVGILPAGFTGLNSRFTVDLYLPMARAAQMQRWYTPEPDNWWVQMAVRLKPGARDEQLRASGDVMLNRLALALGASRHEKISIPKLRLFDGRAGLSFLEGRMSDFLTRVLGMVGLVLLIGCANVANLMLARGTTRAREMAIRLSLGAGRGRLIRHMLAEGILIAVAGGVLGLLLARIGTVALAELLLRGEDGIIDIRPDSMVLAFTALLSIGTVLLFALLPAWRSTRVDASSCLKQGSAASRGSGSRLSNTLVAVQVALAMMLLVGAGLFGRTLVNLAHVELGFRPERLLLFSIDPSRNGYKDQRLFDCYHTVQEKLAALPGVTDVTLTQTALISGGMSSQVITVPGYQPKGEKYAIVYVHVVGERYFKTFGQALPLGREFTWSDSLNAPLVAVVNQTMAKKYFGNENPLGREFSFSTKFEKPVRVVGVVADSKYTNVRDEIPATVYVPLTQSPHLGGLNVVVKSAGDPMALAHVVRRVIAEIDPLLPVANLRTQEQQIDRTLSRERTFAFLAMFFSSVGMALAAIGLYGVLAYAVTRRTSEFGVRAALGATSRNIRWLAVRGALVVVASGIAVGVPAALLAARTIQKLLFGVPSTDPWTLVIAGGVMMLAAALAAWIPARRAGKADPAVALRYE